MLGMAKRTTGGRNVKVISSKLVYKGPVFTVHTDIVREGPHTGQRDVIRHSGSVVVLALDRPKRGEPRVLLCRQYRYAAAQSMWELPAGRIDKGENRLAAAKRELIEETGVRAKRWQRMCQFYASPGFLDETMDIYLAEGLTLGEATPEEDEQISIRFFPLSEAVQMVLSGRIKDAKTMTGVLWVEGMRTRGKASVR